MLTDDERARRVGALWALERKEALFATRPCGWSAWRVMRNPIYNLAMALPLASPARSTLTRSLQALAATFRLAWLLLVGQKRNILVKTGRTGLRVAHGDRFRDVYFDGLLERGHTHLKLEDINSGNFDEQAKRALFPSHLDPVVFTFWGKVLGTLFPVDAMAFCETAANSLSREVGIDIEPGWLRHRISTAYWQSRMYGLLLRRTGIKTALSVDTGDYALCIACHRNGVRFIELQHGVFNAMHPDAIPDWVEGTAAELLLPHYLASRGTYWIGQLAGTHQGGALAVPVGDEQIDVARTRMRARRPEKRLHIVVTSQGLDRERLARWIGDIAAAAPANIDCSLSLKLHPAYDHGATAYDTLRSNPRVRIIGGSEQPNVFDLLCDADLHLSIASACHFDAASLGVPTGVIPLAGHEQILDAVDGRRFVLIDSPEAVWPLAANAGVESASGREFAEPGFVGNLEGILA